MKLNRIECLSRLLFERLRREVPDLKMESFDYGWSFACGSPSMGRAVNLYLVSRSGEPEYRLRKRDIGRAVAYLKEAA